MNSIRNAADLVTSKEAIVEGFKWQAHKKSEIGSRYTQLLLYFRSRAAEIKNASELFTDPQLFEFCLLACSLSRKSRSHLTRADQQNIVTKLIDVTSLKDPAYQADLEQRYFLTCGDSLGGTMRNEIGKAAQKKFTDALISTLASKNINARVTRNGTDKVTAIYWQNRHMFFDRKPRFINKSIDFIVLRDTNDIEDFNRYVACGELKGGIDPAGADEHWKTASTALNRIDDVFQKLEIKTPALFFVGTAIESAMADEIYARMTAEGLIAANLTKDNQVRELVQHLIEL